ncbi:SapC family protein [Peristeroidobacter soli]|uniref:SapC family protein n=1 Tax=Peristeroidobacter soli TaxID=2497877 RepID=UPI00101C0F38|nr:SapC family protein [Peristeroidobacter soli]
MTSQTSESDTPLFYRDPQLISSRDHAHWRIRDGGVEFAQQTIAVPIVIGEFIAAARCFPILFSAAGDTINPIALLGLDANNLFVKNGRWIEGVYIPAYVRRYPFGFIEHRDGVALGIDAASERIVRDGDEGQPLFESGEPTDVTRQALQFCDAYRAEADVTQAFCQALQTQNLLIDRRADATLPNGRKFAVDGFRIVDVNKFRALDAASVVEWHHKGWLALVHHHLASLDRFEDLLARRGARDRESLSDQAVA